MEKPKLLKDLGMHFPNEKSKKKSRYGIFKCACGNTFKTCVAQVKSGKTKSCGCIRLKNNHSEHYKDLYTKYNSMKQRCYYKKGKRYSKYGGRGIVVCESWLNDFKSFHDWAICSGYKKGLSLDRINNDGNYEPSNCRWTTMSVQNRNTSKLYVHNTSGYRGVTFEKRSNKFVAQININNKNIYIGKNKCRLACAYMYDNYVKKNKLEHTKNFT